MSGDTPNQPIVPPAPSHKKGGGFFEPPTSGAGKTNPAPSSSASENTPGVHSNKRPRIGD